MAGRPRPAASTRLNQINDLGRRNAWHEARIEEVVSQEISLPAIDVGEGTRRAMQAIEAYLARHALAADTEDGIVQWWLPEMGVDVPLVEARLALQSLVKQGRIRCRSLPGGTLIYHAAPAAN